MRTLRQWTWGRAWTLRCLVSLTGMAAGADLGARGSCAWACFNAFSLLWLAASTQPSIRTDLVLPWCILCVTVSP